MESKYSIYNLPTLPYHLLTIFLQPSLYSIAFFISFTSQSVLSSDDRRSPVDSTYFSFNISRLPDYNNRCQFQFGSPFLVYKFRNYISYPPYFFFNLYFRYHI